MKSSLASRTSATSRGDHLSKSVFTVKVFGVYALVLGIALIVVPNLLLGIFGLPVTSEVWIRVVGVVVFNIGVAYWFAAKSEARAFFQGTVYSRSFVLVAFVGFWLLGFVKAGAAAMHKPTFVAD